MKSVLRLSVWAILGAGYVWSQTITASLEGLVKDPSGALVTGATARVLNTGTNSALVFKTDQDGRFFAPILQPGTYTVTVEAQGFRRVERTNIQLDVAQAARIEIELPVGSVSEVVAVTAEATMIDATSSSVGHVLTSEGIENLPMNQRNPLSLVLLVPGMVGTVGDDVYGLNFSVNGGRAGSSDVLLDGVTASVPSDASQRITMYPSVDAVAEFRVQTNNYSAEFGSSGGGIINLIYKSGTNQLHGSGYDYLRNSIMDSNTWANNKNGVALASFKRNQFGGSLGGPVVIPKLYNGRDRFFFFVDYEGLRQLSASSLQTTMPTIQEKNGDFSNTRNAAGQVITIYNPFSTTAAGSAYTRTPMPGNIIPANLINPISALALKYWPAPNEPGNQYTQANNYYQSGAAVTDIDQYDIKGDYNISDQQRLSIRGSRRYLDTPATIYFPTAIEAAENGDSVDYAITNAVLNYTFTVSPTFVSNFRMGYSRVLKTTTEIGTGFDETLPSTLGFPSYIKAEADALFMSGLSPSGYYGIGAGTNSLGVLGLDTQSYQLANTKVTSRHTIKFGVEFRLYNNDTTQQQQPTGSYTFTTNFTSGPNPVSPVSVGDGFASFLFGTPSTGTTLKNYRGTSTRSDYWAPYINDDWKVTSKLTVNAGLRWDLTIPQYERYNRANYFDPTIPNPLGNQIGLPNLKGGLVFYGVNGAPRRTSTTEWDDFAPRLGLAYQLNQRTVIRAAYGIFFAPPSTAAGQSLGVIGFAATTSMVTSLNGGITPDNLLNNPYPQGYLPITGSALGLNTALGSSVTAQLYGVRNPYIQNWNFGIQRSLPGGIIIDASYVGTKGTYLVTGAGGYGLNQMPPQYLSLGAALTQQVPNPFYGTIATGSLSGTTVPRYQLLLPYPQFTSVSEQFATGSNSIYHSGQLKVEKRFSNGMSFLLAYAKSKSIDDGSVDNGNFTGGAVSNNGYQNIYDRAAERSVSPFDVPQRLVLSFVYDLPFGRGRMLGKNWNRAVDAALGGWQVNGIVTYQKGVPLELSANIPVSGGVYGSTLRPNSNGQNAELSGPAVDRLNEYFNTSDFSIPPAYTLGDVSRTLPNIRSPGIDNYDLSAFKNFKPREKLTVQLRVESFNALNHPQFAAPSTSINSVTFGEISNTANTPRNMQVALKLLF
jgi:outer membrane receptor protein involved in Fe transport